MTAAAAPIKFMRLFLEALAKNEIGLPYDGPPALDMQLEVEAHLVQTFRVTENGGTVTVTTGNTAAMLVPLVVIGYSTKPIRWEINVDHATDALEPISQWLFLVNEDGTTDLRVDSIKLTNTQAADGNANDALVTILVGGNLS